jgi:Protein of unknown function (DUF1579)
MKSRVARFAVLPSAGAALVALLALAAALSFTSRPLHAADPQAQAAAPAPAPGASDDAQAKAKAKAEMDAYMKLAQPGEHHKHLGNLAGKWKTSGKMMTPGQPPIEMGGTMEASWILGGRYLQELHTGSFMGQPFEGRSLDGYDNITKEYFSTWVDNMGTGVMVFHGSCDDPCKVLTETAEGPDPMTGKVVKTKNVTTFVDPDTYRFEMYMVGAGKDGQDTKIMDMIAKREK